MSTISWIQENKDLTIQENKDRTIQENKDLLIPENKDLLILENKDQTIVAKSKFYLVTGFTGSGKTTFCKNKIHLSIDEIFNYKLMSTNYEKLSRWVQDSLKKSSEIYLDGYIFDTDPGLKKLLELVNQCDIKIIFLYAANAQLYREAFIGKLKHAPIFLEFNKMSNGELSEMIKSRINNILTAVDSYNLPIQFLCRTENNQLIVTDRNHLIETVAHL